MKLAYIANINCPLIVLRCFQPASHLDRDCGGTVETTGWAGWEGWAGAAADVWCAFVDGRSSRRVTGSRPFEPAKAVRSSLHSCGHACFSHDTSPTGNRRRRCSNISLYLSLVTPLKLAPHLGLRPPNARHAPLALYRLVLCLYLSLYIRLAVIIQTSRAGVLQQQRLLVITYKHNLHKTLYRITHLITAC